LKLYRYDFEGLFESGDKLQDLPGIFAVISFSQNKAVPVDVGESDRIGKAVRKHQRRGCREKSAGETGYNYAACFTRGSDRDEPLVMVREIRGEYDVPCGLL
jgi:hypothetical protein